MEADNRPRQHDLVDFPEMSLPEVPEMVRAKDTKSANLNTFKPKKAALPAVVIEPEQQRRKIALLGSASSSIKLAPYDDQSWEFWNLAWRVHDSPRNDLLFEIHERQQWKWNQGGTDEVLKLYTEFLQNTKLPIFLLKEQLDIPAGKAYPMREVIEAIGREYFASSIGFMLGYLIYQIKQGREVDEVGLWGIDLLCEDEFAEQRPNAEYLLGMLHAMGVKVTIPSQSALLKSNHVYGRDTAPDKGGINQAWLKRRRDEYAKNHATHLEAAHSYSGAQQAADLFAQDPATAPESERPLLVRAALTDEQRAVMAERARVFKHHHDKHVTMLHRLDGAKELVEYLVSMAAHYERGGVLPD